MGLQVAVNNYFKGKSKTRVYLTIVVVNVVLMFFLFYLLLNTYAYDWTGQLYPEGSGYNLATGLDQAIPFIPQMAIFYIYLFYSFSILTMVYFGFIDYKKGYALGLSLIAINAVAIAVYVVFPVSSYWYRQDLIAHPIVGSFWANQVYSVFQNDTSFNCFPSLHAAIATICAYAWVRYAQIKPAKVTKAVAIVTVVIAAGVVLSTLFIKQHYIADEVAGVALALVVGWLVLGKLWKNHD